MKISLLSFGLFLSCLPLSSASLSEKEEAFFSSFREALNSHPFLHLAPDDLRSPEMTVVPDAVIYSLPKQTTVSEYFDVGFQPPLVFPVVEDVSLFRSGESIAAVANEERSLSGIVFRRALDPIEFDDLVPEGISHQATSKAIENLKELAQDDFLFLTRLAATTAASIDAASNLESKIEALLMLHLRAIMLPASPLSTLKQYQSEDRRVLLSLPDSITGPGEAPSIGAWAIIALKEYPHSIFVLLRSTERDTEELLESIITVASTVHSPAEEAPKIEPGEGDNSE